MCVFKRELLGTPEVSSTNSFPTRFHSQKLWGLIFLALEPCGEGPGMELGLLAPKISLQNFYLLHMDIGAAHSMSEPFLPVGMNVDL